MKRALAEPFEGYTPHAFYWGVLTGADLVGLIWALREVLS